MMSRRHFLTAGAAAAVLGDSWSTAASEPVRIGQQPLKLGSDRDGVLFVPKGYKPDVPTPLAFMLRRPEVRGITPAG